MKDCDKGNERKRSPLLEDVEQRASELAAWGDGLEFYLNRAEWMLGWETRSDRGSRKEDEPDGNGMGSVS